MATSEQKLKEVKRKYNDAKQEEIRIATRLDEAKKRRKEAKKKIEDKGHDVKDLKTVIKDKEDLYNKTIEEIESYLPSEDDDDEEFGA